MSDHIPENHSSRYLDGLERVLAASGMTQTMFGYINFGDPGFMTRARGDHRFQRKTVEKIKTLLASERKGK